MKTIYEYAAPDADGTDHELEVLDLGQSLRFRGRDEAAASSEAELGVREVAALHEALGEWLASQAKWGSALTAPQLAMLRNARSGRSLVDGLRGRSEHGGATRTQASLVRAGYLTSRGRITPAGLAAIPDPAPRSKP